MVFFLKSVAVEVRKSSFLIIFYYAYYVCLNLKILCVLCNFYDGNKKKGIRQAGRMET